MTSGVAALPGAGFGVFGDCCAPGAEFGVFGDCCISGAEFDMFGDCCTPWDGLCGFALNVTVKTWFALTLEKK